MQEKYSHRVAGRIIDILDMISDSENGYTFMELSNELDVPKGSLSPILKTLKESNLLSYNELTSHYSLGLKVYELGCSFLKKRSYLDYVMEIMEEIVKECGETCYFGVLDHGQIVYLLKVDSPKEIRMVAITGKRLPAYSSAIGKALLSGVADIEELKAIYPDGLTPMTANTITSFDTLYSQIEEIRETGFAYECEESSKHIACVARPICKGKNLIAAISIATPVFRYNSEKVEKHKNLLSMYGKEIEDHIHEIDISFLRIT